MHSKLLAEASGNASFEVLLPRQTNDQPLFFCDGATSQPFVYTYVLSGVTGVICTFFHYGITKLGRIQIIERYNLQDVGGAHVKTTFKYLWYYTSYASASSCASAMQYGIDNACKVSFGVRMFAEQRVNRILSRSLRMGKPPSRAKKPFMSIR